MRSSSGERLDTAESMEKRRCVCTRSNDKFLELLLQDERRGREGCLLATEKRRRCMPVTLLDVEWLIA